VHSSVQTIPVEETMTSIRPNHAWRAALALAAVVAATPCEAQAPEKISIVIFSAPSLAPSCRQ
jgi:hypothetical protein